MNWEKEVYKYEKSSNEKWSGGWSTLNDNNHHPKATMAVTWPACRRHISFCCFRVTQYTLEYNMIIITRGNQNAAIVVPIDANWFVSMNWTTQRSGLVKRPEITNLNIKHFRPTVIALLQIENNVTTKQILMKLLLWNDFLPS